MGDGQWKIGFARASILETARADGISLARIVVFTGPTLHPSEARDLEGSIILPPIKRGDLDIAKIYDPEIIAIIDGEFYQSLAVSPKEILPFLERGVRVYGAASMGALRAVELEKFGMIGIGKVFRLFRLKLLECDDEVALAYCPRTYKAYSEPLVNTRYTLRLAIRNGIVTRAESARVLEILKSTYFPERTRQFLLSAASATLGSKRARAFEDFLAAHPVNAKAEDAKSLMLELSRL